MTARGAELKASIAEIAGPIEVRRDDGAEPELDVLPSFEAPSDRPLTTARSLADRALAGGRSTLHATGVAGGAAGLVLRALARQEKRRIVAVAADVDAARALAADASFLLGARDADDAEATGGATFGRVLLYTPSDASPYADVNPDRRGAETRLATLFHLAVDLPWQVLVCPVAALARKVVPKEEVLDHAELVVAGQEIDRDKLLSRLAAAGYVRVPLVEDPGTMAVRGALLDVWAPCADAPVRIEFYGDLVMSLKPFDPEDQRTTEAAAEGAGHDMRKKKPKEIAEAWLPPVREAIAAPERAERARQRVRALCDAVDLPSTKARALVDDVASGRSFFGSEGYLPAFVDLAGLSDYLPEDAVVVLEDPAAITRALRDELGRAAADESAKHASPHFKVDAFYASESEVARWLCDKTVVCLHTTGIEGDATESAATLERFEVAPAETPSLATQGQEDLERAIKAARQAKGKTGALDPLVRRVTAWREAGLSVVVAARAATQVERLVTLLRHRDVPVKARLGAFDPATLDGGEGRGAALVVTGSLARGVVAPCEGLALVTEEEIFGARAHRRAGRAQKSATGKARAFVEDLRSLTVGDYVVHVEHGIGKYLGLVHKEVAGLTVDLITVEYAGGDKLYLPVYRLNQIQKFSGGEGAPKIDRLGGQTFAKTKARVAKHLRKMADELLRLYAERRAAAGDALPQADDDYRAFEATFPFDETPDQARAIAEVNGDLETPRPMDRLVCGDVGFGKTEVAIRAAFRVASNGQQVAVLCPTTVLAQQHYLNFRDRMAAYPLKVAVMSRFSSKQEQDETARGLRDGTVDVVV
ncbi:MAG TPA: CarD family transcriptional regulator, partial [Minicystis sp.]|nr:CarD family transcriptional regulator [Minicystis sp.]